LEGGKSFLGKKFAIPTGAQRSGGICGCPFGFNDPSLYIGNRGFGCPIQAFGWLEWATMPPHPFGITSEAEGPAVLLPDLQSLLEVFSSFS
jgi:hypothetical protein